MLCNCVWRLLDGEASALNLLEHMTVQRRYVFKEESTPLWKIWERTFLKVCGLNDVCEAFRAKGMFDV